MHYMKSVQYPQWSDDNRKFVDVPDLDDCFAAIRDRVLTEEAKNKHLVEENKKLKSEAYKDEELQKIKTELDAIEEDYYRGFPISKEENEAIKEWINNHMDEKHSYIKNGKKVHKGSGAIGGRFTYEFIPTTIGTVGTIKCDCGAEFCFCELC